MALSEGVQARLAYKFYSSGTMVANAEPAVGTDPAATGGKVLRRVSHSLNLRKNTYRSAEVRADRQVGDFRHGGKRVEGSITGEFSPSTYFDFLEAAHRDTKSASITKGNSEFTSVAADNATAKFTFAGGDPVSEGFRVGDIIRFTNLSVAANNSTNYLIRSFGGTSNRELTVYPAPTDMTTDSAFSVTRPGAATIVPASGHVSRRVLFEDYDAAIDVTRLFKECRISGYRLGLPSEGMLTFEAMAMGRGMDVLTDSSSPFFASPTAQTSTGITAAVNGLLLVGGTAIGVVTGLNIGLSMPATAPTVVGQVFPPDIFLGTADVTGDITALFFDDDLINNFINEDEISVLAMVTASNAAAADAVSIYLPRIKLTGADVDRQGETEQPLRLPFQALRYLGSAAGIETTTIRIHDTAAS